MHTATVPRPYVVLDGRGMPVLRFSCCKVNIEVAFDASIPICVVQALLPPGSLLLITTPEPAPPEHRFSISLDESSNALFVVRQSRRRLGPPSGLHRALLILRKGLNLCVAEYAKNRTFVHAGVVHFRGRGIVLPGPSHYGKSSLIWALLQVGATYYSDEYAVFDHDGRMHPFPIPLNLRTADGTREIAVADRVGTSAVSADVILFATYRPNAVWRPTLLRPAEAVLKLLRNSVSMRQSPATSLPTLVRVASNTKAYYSRRGEADTVVNWLIGLAT